MTKGSQRLAEYQRQAEKIEEAFREGGLTPIARRRMLELARDASGVVEPSNRLAPPPHGQSGKLVSMSREEINAAKRAGRTNHARPAANSNQPAAQRQQRTPS